MEDSTVWWLLAGAAVALELLSGSFFLLVVAIAMAAGAIAAHFDATLTQQLLSAALVGGGGTALWYKWRRLHPRKLAAQLNPDVNLDIGQSVEVAHWEPNGQALVKYRGAQWQVALQTPAESALPGRYKIVEVQGSLLIVQPIHY
jgi:membrane protein implicated in regulation of membrane protease activity